jgi:hypothetical protein
LIRFAARVTARVGDAVRVKSAVIGTVANKYLDLLGSTPEQIDIWATAWLVG